MHIFIIDKGTDAHHRFDMWYRYSEWKKRAIKQLAITYGFQRRDLVVLNADEFGFYANSESHLAFYHECRKRNNRFDMRRIKRYSKLYEPIQRVLHEAEQRKPKQPLDLYFYRQLLGHKNHIHTMYYRERFYVAVHDLEPLYEQVMKRMETGEREPLERCIDEQVHRRFDDFLQGIPHKRIHDRHEIFR